MRRLRSLLPVSVLALLSACSSSSSPATNADASTPASDSGSHDSSVDATGDAPASDSATPAEGGACNLHGTAGGASCDTCVAASCCNVANACFDDTGGCNALLACVTECKASDGGTAPDAGTSFDGGVAECESLCANTYPGTQAASDLINCESSSCSSECFP